MTNEEPEETKEEDARWIIDEILADQPPIREKNYN